MKGFTRPNATVLPDAASIPARNLIVPPPNQLTHEISRPAPYWYEGAEEGAAPAGAFPAGTRVILLADDGSRFCRVSDARGLYVQIEADAVIRRNQPRTTDG